MVKAGKKTKEKRKNISATQTLTRLRISAKSKISTNLKRLHEFIRSVPNWIKGRPIAFKKWRLEDKKKKKYRSFKLQKKIKPEPRYIPPAWHILKDTFKFIWRYNKIFLGIFLVHVLIYFALVRTPVVTNISTIQESVESVLGEGGDKSVKGTFATLGSVIGLSSTSQTNTVAITILALFMSFVYIWTTRQLHAVQSIKIRDAYYQSLTPVVPTLIILAVLSLQLVPFAVSSFIYTTARAGGLFANGFEDLSIFLITALIALLCFYWITSTIIALYIVTLPGMYPLEALKGAKKLVEFRRFIVFKRIVVLPVLLGLVYTSVLFIVVRFFPGQAFITAELSQLLFLPIVHIYLYKLYRALL